ncbi:hypothetical protein HY357_00040 [Candidatus Roizmanbacteria bacterium]|nr:hypothetical protein [Candidatus Roizmanbacteria bacterium]
MEVLFFLLTAVFLIRPIQDYDFWFHLKIGEDIVKTGQIPFTDIYSHTALGGRYYPHEWLTQSLFYLMQNAFGDLGIQIIIILAVLLYLFILRQILLEIFAVGLFPRLVVLLSVFIFSFDFFVERPQIISYVFFIFLLYLILKKVFLGKNWLWMSVPLFLLWSNMHATYVFGLYLLFGFFLAEFLYKKLDSVKASSLFFNLDLLPVAIVNSLITILPPLGTTDYQLLLLNWQKRELISSTIVEWRPLYEVSLKFFLYFFVWVIIVIANILMFRRKNSSTIKSSYVLIPLIPITLLMVFNIRQTPFSSPALLILLAPLLTSLQSLVPIHWQPRRLLEAGFLLFAVTALFFIRKQTVKLVRPLPTNSIAFIKNNLKGNIFNEHAIGGYLLYRLGPKHKVFIDGRTDMYMDKVLPDYHGISENDDTDAELMVYFDDLLNKYDVSWVILSTKRLSIWQRIAKNLAQDKRWSLVFFDDTDEIFVRDDGKNAQAIKYEIKAATPFSDRLYQQNKLGNGLKPFPTMRDAARKEYERMLSIAPSAVSANALGYFLLEDMVQSKGGLPGVTAGLPAGRQAKKYFEKALKINPNATSPKMNLAELAAAERNWDQAISLYREALEDDYEKKRGFGYVRLGEFIIDSGGSVEEAKKIWEEGIINTINQDVRKKLEMLINEN